MAPAAVALFLASLIVQRPIATVGGFGIILPDLAAVPLALLAVTAAVREPARLRKIASHPLVIAIAIYLAAMLFSPVVSSDRTASLHKLATQIYLLGLPVVVALALPDLLALRDAVRGWLGGTALLLALAVVGLAAWLADPSGGLHRALDNGPGSLAPGPYPRLMLSFANPNMMAHYLGLTAPLVLAARAIGWIGSGAAKLLVAMIFVTALAAVSPQLAGLLFAMGWWFWLERRRDRPFAAATALIAALGVVVVMQVVASVVPAAPTVRVEAWRAAFESWRQAPLLGRGLGVDAVAVRFTTPDGVLHTLNDAHNQALSLLAQVGIAGLAAFGWLLWRIAAQLRDSGDPLGQALAVALITGAAIQGLTGSFEDSRAWWAMLGLLLAASVRRESSTT
ncbi:hypothetical protein H9L12_07725 [Sphingomonas rhizophila]|uniref:O-antigen ligase-related domain-containing protein n=1 Tax=Sphingomonas rhizophila TaxID=2071607 RepID=A0A7G9S8S5_9SPHN|nr:O-antigen ligase family protein [Sphingomonas rhizophila]QNN64250.1 hypothetical protein H9L12_07725 [Sphingomonas rhizophila]